MDRLSAPLPPFAHRVQFAAYRALAACVAPLGDRAAARVGALLGEVVFACAWSRRRVARVNLAHALGAASASLAREAFRSGGRLVVECLRLPAYRGRMRDVVRVTGLEHLARARDEGRGAIIFTGHLGNWELIGPALVAHGVPVTLLVGRQHNALVDAWLNAERRALGEGTTPLVGGMRAALHVLRRGEVVGLLVDQHVRRGGVMVPYFGRPASTGPAAARIARASGARLVPVAITRDQDGVHHTLAIEEPLDVHASSNVTAVTAHVTRAVEDAVRRAPGQYFWFHRRWKARASDVRGIEEGETEDPGRVLQGAGDLATRSGV